MMNPSQPPLAPVCCLCQTVFKDPKVLPCLHTFCSNCLQTLAASESAMKEVTCPTCGCFVTLPPSGVAGLKTNVFVKRLAEMYFQENKKNTQSEIVEPDEGFADHTDVLAQQASTIPRSETWHGQPTVSSAMSSIVESRSVNGDTPLSSFTSTTTTTTTTSVPDVSPQAEDAPKETSTNTAEQNHARVEMKKEACAVTGKLTTKLMHLQGEALRITYAIDTVNQTVNHWRERNIEIKAQIQNRSQVLQNLIKRHEQKLLAEVDNLDNHEQFLNEADKAKTDLRGNLKRVLNAVQFLKQIQNFAQDEEILEMKDFLLGDLKILTSVETSQKEFTLQPPTTSSYEDLTNDFGNLTSEEKKSTVFEPDNGNTGEGSGGMKLTQLEKVKQMEFTKASNSKFRKRRAKTQQIRFSSPQGRKPDPQRRATRIITSEDRDMERSSPEKSSPESDESVDITDLQETLKQRRREIIEEKHVEEDLGNIHDVQLLSVHRRPAREKKRRVQSFGGRASSRTRLMEQAAKEFCANDGGQRKPLASLDKAQSLDSADGQEEITPGHSEEAKPEAGVDMSTKLKYLHEKWRQRREILRSSGSSFGEQGSGEVSPTSPVSPISPTDKAAPESKFHMLQDQISSIRHHFSPNDINPATSPNQSPSHKASPSPHGSTGSVSETSVDVSYGSPPSQLSHQNGTSNRRRSAEHVLVSVDATDSSGLTRSKLRQIRANAREKKERWRSETLS